MKWHWFLLSLLAVLAAAEESSEELEAALPCDPEACKLPECRCSSTNIPGNLAPRNTPQFVTVTFDDAVTISNIDLYRDLLYDRTNMNNCPVGTTFFVSHEYTNYQFINELYNRGFEIALHSISHRTPQTWWQEASVEDLVAEFGGQQTIFERFANIPRNAIRGVRSPFLQMAGNATFQMMKEIGISYDCSWPTSAFTSPGLWPYSLDYASTQDCNIPPCPAASFPGIWVKPMVNWHDLNGQFCSMADQCFPGNVPPVNDEEGWFRFIVGNFERHYLGNRAPFGYYVHAGYLSVNPAVRRALVRFLDMINNLPDAYMVNVNDVVEWTKNPVPVDQYRSLPCKVNSPAMCWPPMSCGPLRSTHTENSFWMAACGPCPARYPWLDDPLGATPLP